MVLAFPALAGADPTGSAEGAALGSLAGPPGQALSYWTPGRLEDAEPLPIVTLPGVPPEAGATAPLARRAAARAAAIDGIEVAAGESTLFPNSANGKIYGVFEIPKSPTRVEIEKYQCSGSVVDSPFGNVVLTAGHCVIDPDTGRVASKGKVIFVPGFRDCSDPFGAWEAVSYATTESWKDSAGTFLPNEGGDLALLVLNDNEAGESVEEAAGSLGIGFEEPRSQLYTQYGYPAASPYGGEALYSHTAAYQGPDVLGGLLFSFSPLPMQIASDFTEGASGGPWTVGPSDSPKVLSVTAYGYEGQPDYLYGPYFGPEARAAYERAAGSVTGQAPGPDLGSLCERSPEDDPGREELTPTPPGQGAPPPAAQPGPPAAAPVTLRLTRIHRRANGSAVLTTKVSDAGRLKLRGAAVRTETVRAPAAGKYRLVVAPRGKTNRKLRRRGRAKVGVKVAFRASGSTRRISRRIQLRRRTVARTVRHHARRSG